MVRRIKDSKDIQLKYYYAMEVQFIDLQAQKRYRNVFESGILFIV